MVKDGGEKPLVVVFALFNFLYLPPHTHISMKFFSLQELYEEDDTCLEPVTPFGESSLLLALDPSDQYIPQRLNLRLKSWQTRMRLESQFWSQNRRLLCVQQEAWEQ